jgi:hypothetical protein
MSNANKSKAHANFIFEKNEKIKKLLILEKTEKKFENKNVDPRQKFIP